MRFVLGLLVGLLPLGGYIAYEHLQRGEDPCLQRCGDGTRCEEGSCVVASQPRRRGRRSRRRGRRGRRSRRRAAAAADAPQLERPTAAQLRAVSRGPSLRRTDVINMDEAGAAAGGRELSTAEVTARVRRQDQKVVACIDRARGNYDLSGAKVVVGFRIERSGKVSAVRVTMPALLARAGLRTCLEPLFSRLRFPRSTRALVMTFPYAL